MPFKPVKSFNDPGSGGGDKLPLNDLNGDLLLFTVHELVHEIPTKFGVSDAVRADVAVLDGPSKGATYNDTLIFPRVLRSQLRDSVGEMVLGRLGQGEAKGGQDPPWLLFTASDDEKTIGTRYLAYVEQQQAHVAQPVDDESPF